MADFDQANRDRLALDAEGNLTFLAGSEWRLDYVAKQWPEIEFHATREHDDSPARRSTGGMRGTGS